MHRLIATSVAAALGVTLAAQEARPPVPRPLPEAQPQTPVFRSAVDLVTLDVSVIDGNRRPIRGLGPADFTVLEDGKPQTIAVFSAVEIPYVEPPKTAWTRDVAPDVRTNEDVKERRLFLIIVDDATVEGDIYALTQLRNQTRNFINKLAPSDLAAIVFTMDNRKSRDFTSDRAQLLKAVDTLPMGMYGMEADASLAFTNAWYEQQAVETIRRAVDVLAGITDRRRSIVYIGNGVPVDLGIAATPASLGLTQGASAASQAAAADSLAYRMYMAFRSAALGNVAVNTVDVCGLRPPEGFAARPKDTCVAGLRNEFLRNIAQSTGGRAIVDTNEYEPGLDAIFRENSSYYLLAYQSTDPKQDGRFRRIDVRVNRPGLTVKTRAGYVPEKPDAVAKRKAKLAEQPLGAAISGVLPKSDLPMRLTAVPFAIPGKKESSVLVMLGVSQPVRDTGVRTVEKVDLQLRAYNTDGRMLGATNLRADVTVRAGATGLAEYEMLARLDLAPGRYQLRTAANVGALTTSGSLYYDIDVPDFQKAPLSVSGIVFTANPAMPIGGLKPFLPVAPTTQRKFGPGTQVSAFFRVYRGGRDHIDAVPVRIQVRNSSDVVVLDRKEVLDGPPFVLQRWANVNVDLPVGRMPAGEYLLTVEAVAAASTVHRSIRFEVVK